MQPEHDRPPVDLASGAAVVASRILASVPDDAVTGWFVMLCGVTHSGKSTWADRHPALRKLLLVRADRIRDLVDEVFGFGDEAKTLAHPARQDKGEMVRVTRELVFERAFASGMGVLSDASNRLRPARQRRLAQARSFRYSTAIVWVHTPEAVLLSRLRADDASRAAQGLPPFWVPEYEHVHRPNFDPPRADEADAVIQIVGTVANDDADLPFG